MALLNCWEFMKCGREPGGKKEKELGTCIAAAETKLDGINGSKNGGRGCWVIAGNICLGPNALKIKNCLECSFYILVKAEEGPNFKYAKST